MSIAFTGFKYQLDNLPEDIKEALLEILNRDFITEYSQKAFEVIDYKVNKRKAEDKASWQGLMDFDIDAIKDILSEMEGYDEETFDFEFEETEKKKSTHYGICQYAKIRCIPENVHESYIPYLQKTMEELLAEDRDDKSLTNVSSIESINEAIKDFPHIFEQYKHYPFKTNEFMNGFEYRVDTTEFEDGRVEVKNVYSSRFRGDDEFYHYEIFTNEKGEEVRIDYNEEGEKINEQLS
jgi:hypothetical protein